jgi:hypothetical protein
MKSRMVQSLAPLALALSVAALAGCPAPEKKPAPQPDLPAPAPEAPAAPAEERPPAAGPERPRLTAVRDHTFTLPGMDCLVNEHGLRVKVLVTRPGTHCLDRVPGGNVAGAALNYFHPYFVFDVFPRQGALQFYQVGTTPRRDSVVGWAPAGAVSRWDTRVGARYHRPAAGRVPPLLVYRDKQALLDVLRTGSTKAEPVARAAWKAKRTRMPWPIVEVVQVTVDGQAHELVLLNFLGQVPADGDLPAPPAGEAPPPALFSPREVRAIQARVRQLDVVFVLDVTGSMGPYIEAAKATVRELTRRFKELDFEPDVAFGLVAYRDHDKQSGFVTRHFDLESDCGRFLDHLAGLKAAGGGDQQEAVYDGLDDALRKTSWRGQGLSARAVVLIGDASGHEPGDPQNPRNISRDDLVNEARRAHAKIFALAVGGETDARGKPNPDWPQLWRQFSDLARRSGGDCFPVAKADAVVERVRSVLTKETATQARRAVVVADLARGRTPEQIAAGRSLDVRQVTEVMELLKGAGVEVRRLGAGGPTFASGWALCELHGVPILEREVYVARAELDVLLASLNLLCSKLTPDFGLRAVGPTLSSRIDPLSTFFEGDLPEPLDVFLLTKGVPVGRSSILRLTAAEVRHMPEERRAVLRERIARQVIPALVNARNDDMLWSFRGDLEWGWVSEHILP